MLRTVSGIVILLSVAGCASKSQDVAPAYVSALTYDNYDCQQLTFEAQRISTRATQLAGIQDSNRSRDAVWTTVGVVLFWPALFALEGDNAQTAELAQMKGQMQAIEQASIAKRCGIQFRTAPQPAS